MATGPVDFDTAMWTIVFALAYIGLLWFMSRLFTFTDEDRDA